MLSFAFLSLFSSSSKQSQHSAGVRGLPHCLTIKKSGLLVQLEPPNGEAIEDPSRRSVQGEVEAHHPFLNPVHSFGELSREMQDLIKSTREGSRWSPELSAVGLGGTYFLRGASGEKVAVFKPIDEEPGATSNPRPPSMTGGVVVRKGIRPGEGACREAAAYLLDGHHRTTSGPAAGLLTRGFSGVPPTLIVKCCHSKFNHPNGSTTFKTGSLQKFMENHGSCADYGPGKFTVEQVHALSVLDIMTANTDRHDENLLVKKCDHELAFIPIDHGYCFPESFGECRFVWLFWPQAKHPYNDEMMDFIKSLDVEEELTRLSSGWNNMPIECAQTFRISVILLQKGVKEGLTAFDIGSIMCRDDNDQLEDKPSTIEEIVQEAKDSMLPLTTPEAEAEFLDAVSQIIIRRVKEFAAEKKRQMKSNQTKP